MTPDSVVTLLNELKTLLLEEKEMLIRQESSKIQEIIAKKESFAEQLDGVEVEELNKEAVHNLVKEVKELQETNKMLTKQAINYTEVFLTALQKEVQKDTTYSKKGEVKKSGSSGILDRSL